MIVFPELYNDTKHLDRISCVAGMFMFYLFIYFFGGMYLVYHLKWYILFVTEAGCPVILCPTCP